MSVRKKIIIIALILLAFLAGFLLNRCGRKTEAPLPETAKIPVVEEKAQVTAPEAGEAKPKEIVRKKRIRESAFPQFHKGMTYVTWDRAAYSKSFSDASMANLRNYMGCEYVAIIPTWYQDDWNTAEITPRGKSPSDESVIHAIDEAHRLGLKVMLKPHLDLLNPNCWRGEIDFPDDEGWIKWFENYRDFIVHYAKIAEEHDVEIYCIGVELIGCTVYKAELWDTYVIQEVRKAYTGPITYAANWNEEYLQISFWDKLDYAGLDAYFTLSSKEKPTLEDLKEGWKVHLGQIEEWQKKINKPVIFTEIGYKSSTWAAKDPWEHKFGREVDLQLQSDCYTALLETFWDKPWFYGVYWWYWGTNEKMGGSVDRGFNIQNKPASEVVKDWYKKPGK